MTNLRKALLLACAALTALPLAAQPDCSFTFNFTGASTQTAVSNLSQNTPCVNWRLTLSTTGTLSATVTFYTSPDAITWTAVPNTVCSSSVQPPCVLQGTNPIVGTQGMLYAASYGSYVQVVVTLPSGAGTGTVRGYGAKGATASAPGGGGGGGAGTVTNVATGCGLAGGAITVSGTIIESWLLDPQNGAGAFAIPSTDCGKVISRNQAGAVSDTIAQAGGSFPAGWHLFYQCMGAGGCTITPTTSTINTVASLVLTAGQGVLIVSDGANYTSQGTTAAGGGSGTVTDVFGQTPVVDIPVTTTDIPTPSNPAASHTKWYTKAGTLCALDPSGVETCTGGGGGSGTVTHTGTLTANAVILGNGGVDVKPGAVLPADATRFYDGTGVFSVPAGSGLTPPVTLTGLSGTSYANPQGSGNRQSSIVTLASPNGAWFNGGPWNDNPLVVDGITTTSGFHSGSDPFSGFWMRFDLGGLYVCDEITFYHDTASITAVGEWQGSADGSGWTTLGSSFAMNDAVNPTVTAFANSTPYQYLRILGLSGNTSNLLRVDEVEFKLAAAQSATTTLTINGRTVLNGNIAAAACLSAASPAVCGTASTGSVVLAATSTSVVVNTTAVTANSQIFLMYDSSLSTQLSVTCNATEPASFGITARTAGVSFTITATASVTDPGCFSYFIVN